MLEWRTPEIGDIGLLREYVNKAGLISSDCAPASIYLLSRKYNIKIAEYEGFLFRKYTGSQLPGRDGYAYPLGDGDLNEAINILRDECSEQGKPLKFIFLTEEQRLALDKAGLKCEYFTDDGNSDYLYTAEHLMLLSGRTNHKKKNRVLHFERLHPECKSVIKTEYDAKFRDDIIETEEKWFMDQEERIDSIYVERAEIYEAVSKWNALGLIGIVIYDSMGTPAAMSIASMISPGSYDIHFEKSYGEYARDGGFAYVNREFAKYLAINHNAKWINREEDIGLAGLRKAKMSYNPDLLLKKYHCQV